MNKKFMRTLGVDTGNYNFKTSTKVIFRSVYEEFDYKNELLRDDVILYGDRKYVIGKGEFDNTKVKSHKKNTIPLFLNALYHSLNGAEYATLNVVVGLPFTQHQNPVLVEETKKKYKGEFEFKYISDGVSKDIMYHVNEVLVFPETLGAFYSLEEDMDGRDILLVDIGGGTISIALFRDGEYEDSAIIEEGTIDILRTIAEKASDGKEGAGFTADDMIKYMERGFIKWDGKTDDMEYVDEILEKFANTIVNEIKGSFPKYKSYEIILSGGGVDLLKDHLAKLISFEIIPDNIFANAIGFYNVGADING